MKGVLIGNPVDKSLSHLTHNHIFRTLNLDASYSKKLIHLDAVKEEITTLKGDNYRWIAVTMPLKEKVIEFLDEISPEAKEIGAVNTISIENGKWIGHNTDGIGCLDAIEKRRKVFGQKVVILGAGGSAKAIIYESIQRGAQVTIVNRTEEKGRLLAAKMGARFASQVPTDYDILIHATSTGMNSSELAIPAEQIIPKTLVMDIVYAPLITPLLRQATLKGCEVVTGFEMFCELSYQQFSFIFDEKVVEQMKKVDLKKFTSEYKT